MASILQTLEDEVGNLTTPTTFKMASLEEGNATIFDTLGLSDFPLALCLPFDITDVPRGTSIISSAEINIIFLNKVANDSIDNPAFDIEAEVNAPMRALARQFINRLERNDIIEDEGIVSVVHRTIQSEPIGDAHLHGSWAVFTIKFNEDLTTCV